MFQLKEPLVYSIFSERSCTNGITKYNHELINNEASNIEGQTTVTALDETEYMVRRENEESNQNFSRKKRKKRRRLGWVLMVAGADKVAVAGWDTVGALGPSVSVGLGAEENETPSEADASGPTATLAALAVGMNSGGVPSCMSFLITDSTSSGGARASMPTSRFNGARESGSTGKALTSG